MGSRLNILNGQVFGKLTIVSEEEQIKSIRYFMCRCRCGNKKSISLSKLITGNTVSCGCHQNEVRGSFSITHNLSNSRIYHIWYGMKSRCDNPNSTVYDDYGLRGIKICSEWSTFSPFYEWAMENGYNDNLSIERKDVNGNYEPSNCTWITHKEQGFNKRNTLYAEINGIKKPLKHWAEHYQIDYITVFKRIKRGWSAEEALSIPKNPSKRRRTL